MGTKKTVDILVIGGGINGAGIARDLSGRGFSVILCEKGDLANATSSASTKLIHGGLRYLEHMKFRLVHDALNEREVLLRAAPHIIKPMTFILPHHKKLRPWWFIRLGLFIYDHLAIRKTLPKSKGLSFPGTKIGSPLKTIFKRGFSYSDCWVDDSRLVLLNALAAHEKKAQILTRTECTKIEPIPGKKTWHATLLDNITEEEIQVQARMIVNASGPWVNKVMDLVPTNKNKNPIRWIKGSHIIVKKMYEGEHAYILQNNDKRVIFTIPYQTDYTLIGTTDLEYEGDVNDVHISLHEVKYLCKTTNKFFKKKITPEDIEWTYSGVRPLIDDGDKNASDVTRDYTLDIERHQDTPILNVYGGKITTFRKLSEQVGNMVVKTLKCGRGAWTENAPLPGADNLTANFETFLKTLKHEYSWISEETINRYAYTYGTRARHFLRGTKRISDLGEHLGNNVYAKEIDYLITTEWALTTEDILWRRTKLGLHVTKATEKNIRKFLKKRLSSE